MPKHASVLKRDFTRRSSGILLHLTSLPGEYGSGDLGPEAYQFLRFLEKAGQSWWQMLPVGPPSDTTAFSPYDSASAFAGSPWLVSLKLLERDRLLSTDDLKPTKDLQRSYVNFPATLHYREVRLRKAFATFIRLHREQKQAFLGFCDLNSDWLEDYALFMALNAHYAGKRWTGWDEDLRSRRPEAILKAGERLVNEVNFYRFAQFEFDRQWKALRSVAHSSGIGLIGDLPIFVGHNSSDVWSHQELFQLDDTGHPKKVSGYPPDRFNELGQHWGHPQYRWTEHMNSDFAWWVRRFERMYELFDCIRIDYFLGFTRTWSIPPHALSAAEGQWIKSPGDRLFSAVLKKIGPRPMIAEDLGRVTPADIRLRQKYGLAPTRIFQFGFGTETDSLSHLPHNYPALCAAYTGTHDNNTITGWFRKLTHAQRNRVLSYTGGVPETIHQDILRILNSSCANIVICPLQDILGLGTVARMNVPGTVQGNWSWRTDLKIQDIIIKRLRHQAELFGRNMSK
jgi:4-alpha-glucanotransferase